MRFEDAVIGGVPDEQRVAALRDRYGKVLYEALQRHLTEINPARTRGHPWEEIASGGREYLGIGAEAVIDAWETGQIVAAGVAVATFDEEE